MLERDGSCSALSSASRPSRSGPRGSWGRCRSRRWSGARRPVGDGGEAEVLVDLRDAPRVPGGFRGADTLQRVPDDSAGRPRVGTPCEASSSCARICGMSASRDQLFPPFSRRRPGAPPVPAGGKRFLDFQGSWFSPYRPLSKPLKLSRKEGFRRRFFHRKVPVFGTGISVERPR